MATRPQRTAGAKWASVLEKEAVILHAGHAKTSQTAPNGLALQLRSRHAQIQARGFANSGLIQMPLTASDGVISRRNLSSGQMTVAVTAEAVIS